MTIAIHQPNFFPWLGYFYKISHCDIFVLLDDVQYTKNSFINRNKIKSSSGKEQWITMPVRHTGNFGEAINEIQLDFFERNWKKFLNTLRMNYSKAVYYFEVSSLLEQIDVFQYNNLALFNTALIQAVCGYLDITTPMIFSSSLGKTDTTSTERLVDICKKLDADCYLAGFGSRNYQDDEVFAQHGIRPIVYPFIYPNYQQLYGDFIGNLSIIDVLMNNGKETSKFLL